ncbi:hypothetical protein BKA70DRAFT_1041419, partial [Coprinopsis sp. MPI-PUGE-AT-0042]
MVEIATSFYEILQGVDGGGTIPPTLEGRANEILSALPSKVGEDSRDKLGVPLSEAEIKKALLLVPNEKAPGLDGLPVELWKLFEKRHSESKETNQPTFNVVRVMKKVFNDIEDFGVTEDTHFAE